MKKIIVIASIIILFITTVFTLVFSTKSTEISAEDIEFGTLILNATHTIEDTIENKSLTIEWDSEIFSLPVAQIEEYDYSYTVYLSSSDPNEDTNAGEDFTADRHHQVVFNGLTCDTEYTYIINALVYHRNPTEPGDEYTYTDMFASSGTITIGECEPSDSGEWIFDFTENVGTTSAIFNYRNDVPPTLFEYGTSPESYEFIGDITNLGSVNPGENPQYTELTIEEGVTVSNLTCNTTYYYRIILDDPNYWEGMNESVPPFTGSFTTDPCEEVSTPDDEPPAPTESRSTSGSSLSKKVSIDDNDVSIGINESEGINLIEELTEEKRVVIFGLIKKILDLISLLIEKGEIEGEEEYAIIKAPDDRRLERTGVFKAASYIEAYRICLEYGGITGLWRLPTLSELEKIMIRERESSIRAFTGKTEFTPGTFFWTSTHSSVVGEKTRPITAIWLMDDVGSQPQDKDMWYEFVCVKYYALESM